MFGNTHLFIFISQKKEVRTSFFSLFLKKKKKKKKKNQILFRLLLFKQKIYNKILYQMGATFLRDIRDIFGFSSSWVSLNR
jgi:hypothetical protein